MTSARHFTPASKPSQEGFTAETAMKVYKALRKSGLSEDQVYSALTEMSNAGILFREKIESSAPQKPTCRSMSDHHKSDNNPTGTEAQCDRRDIHGPHEYQLNFGDYFDVRCPGNGGVKKD